MRDVPAEQESPSIVLVNSCLLGITSRYDGRSRLATGLCDLATQGVLLPICPEVVGGLTIPRPPSEVEGADTGLEGHAVLDGRSRVTHADGADVAAQFVRGAEAALAVVQRLGIRKAVLKAHSPSCGAGQIPGSSFDGRRVAGSGVTTALLKRAGIRVLSDTDLTGGKR
jgi:uncharacterized protein YbbK (DUF523 family)